MVLTFDSINNKSRRLDCFEKEQEASIFLAVGHLHQL